MNPTHLDALVSATREAIEAAVTPLLARIEQQASYIQEQFSRVDAELAGVLARLGRYEARPDPATYDDAGLREELREVGRAVQAIEAPARYDDTEVREIIRALDARAAADVQAIFDRVPAAYDDAPLRAQVEQLAASVQALPVPEAYDDSRLIARLERVETELRESLKRLDGLEQAPRPTYDDKDLRDQLASVQRSVGEVRKEFKEIPVPTNGRDAAALEIMPAIDTDKSYPRGTWAKHAGGLWWAFQQTSGMRGWECQVEGIKSITPTVSGKTMGVTVVTSSGDEVRAEAFVPVQVYRGVWADGEFEQGDTATWAGSLWHCNQTGTKAKPGDGSTDWTLAVKKGRDAAAPVKL